MSGLPTLNNDLENLLRNRLAYWETVVEHYSLNDSDNTVTELDIMLGRISELKEIIGRGGIVRMSEDFLTLKDLKQLPMVGEYEGCVGYLSEDVDTLVRQHIRYYEAAYLRVHGEDVDEYGRPCVCVNCCMARQFIKALENLRGEEGIVSDD